MKILFYVLILSATVCHSSNIIFDFKEKFDGPKKDEPKKKDSVLGKRKRNFEFCNTYSKKKKTKDEKIYIEVHDLTDLERLLEIRDEKKLDVIKSLENMLLVKKDNTELVIKSRLVKVDYFKDEKYMSIIKEKTESENPKLIHFEEPTIKVKEPTKNMDISQEEKVEGLLILLEDLDI